MLDSFVTMFYAFLHTIVLECVYDPYIQKDVVPFIFSRRSLHSPCPCRNLHTKTGPRAATKTHTKYLLKVRSFLVFFECEISNNVSGLLLPIEKESTECC